MSSRSWHQELNTKHVFYIGLGYHERNTICSLGNHRLLYADDTRLQDLPISKQHLLVIAFVRLNRTSLDWVWWSLEWFLVARHVGIWTGQVTTPIFLVFRVQIESNNDIYTVLNSIFRGDSPPLSLQHCFLNDTLNIDSIYLSSIYMISLSSPLFIF